MKPLVEVNTNLQETFVLFSDYRLTANYDLCSLNSILLCSQLCLVPSFFSTFIRTKALSVTYLSLNGLPTSSLYHFQNILYLLVHEIKLRLFKLESSFHLNHTPIYFSNIISPVVFILPSQRQDDGPESQNDIVMNPRSYESSLI